MNTRQAILEYLQSHPYSYADELSQALEKTRQNIQYHLKRLMEDGLIAPVNPATLPPEIGRPRSYYTLAAGEKPDNLPALAGALLRLFLPDSSYGEIDQAKMITLAKDILASFAPPSTSTARLNRLVKDLTARGYQARWEAHARGPQILLRNCPYAALIDQHPELCQMDAYILDNNLGATARQVEKIQLPARTACRFIIETPTTARQAPR